MLQQALQSLRRVRPAAFRRVLEQNPKELRALLRALPAILRGRLRTLGQDPVRLQRMRSEPHCPLRKKYYRAAGAQANYAGVLHASRLGVRVDDETFGKMDAVVSLGVKKGQSVRHIVASNPELFKGVKPRTVYDWIDGGLLLAKRHDLPFFRGCKPKRKKMEIKTNAKCRVGRTIQELREWLKENPGVVPCEIDTVIGTISGKVLFTMIFPDTGLALAFLRDAKTSKTCTRIFNMLWEIAGPELFRALFLATLGDNGVEFSDPVMIECYRPDQIGRAA